VLVLDLFCCAGGASEGYRQAGFEVVGVDIERQPHYPWQFIQCDALEYLDGAKLSEFAAIHASPPCQAYSHAQRIRDREHPDLIGEVRKRMQASGLPYVIENVEDARPWLRDPVMLCGAMFPGLRTYRHRLFECSFPVEQPDHPPHTARQTKMGRPPQDGEFMHIVGNFSGVQAAREAMGIDWMVRDELREAIPPAYTRWVGQQLLAHLQP
jgi:DNA (cytosine-5)-methyltransferase 1